MTCYQDCHRHYGYLTYETTIARKLLERHGRPCPETVKELRNETDMSMAECADMLRCMWRDIELERLAGENAKLRELVRDMALNMGGCALHGNPLRLREFTNRARELGVEVPDE